MNPGSRLIGTWVQSWFKDCTAGSTYHENTEEVKQMGGWQWSGP